MYFSISVNAAQTLSIPHYDLGVLFISFIITITIYTVPVLIYRYGIRKSPLSKKHAGIFTIIYVIIAYVIMYLFCIVLGGGPTIGGGLIPWSIVNYIILTEGKSNKKEINDVPEQVNSNIQPSTVSIENEMTPSQKVGETNDTSDIRYVSSNITCRNPKFKFCSQCGTQLPPDSVFCIKCGTKI